jgi:hypothetical protein
MVSYPSYSVLVLIRMGVAMLNRRRNAIFKLGSLLIELLYKMNNLDVNLAKGVLGVMQEENSCILRP